MTLKNVLDIIARTSQQHRDEARKAIRSAIADAHTNLLNNDLDIEDLDFIIEVDKYLECLGHRYYHANAFIAQADYMEEQIDRAPSPAPNNVVDFANTAPKPNVTAETEGYNDANTVQTLQTNAKDTAERPKPDDTAKVYDSTLDVRHDNPVLRRLREATALTPPTHAERDQFRTLTPPKAAQAPTIEGVGASDARTPSLGAALTSAIASIPSALPTQSDELRTQSADDDPNRLLAEMVADDDIPRGPPLEPNSAFADFAGDFYARTR